VLAEPGLGDQRGAPHRTRRRRRRRGAGGAVGIEPVGWTRLVNPVIPEDGLVNPVIAGD
jgi:hypothetical protein